MQFPRKILQNVRLSHDASRPGGHALNDYATANHFRYQSIQDAVDLVTPGFYFAKLDLADKHYSYMIDERLPFGVARSPEIFNRITQAVRKVMKRKGYATKIVFQDDFLVIGRSYRECLQGLNE